MIERSDLINYVEKGRLDQEICHVVVPLFGRFKGETGKRCHLLLLANVINSGIQMRKWVERAVALLKLEGHQGAGPAICESDGLPISSLVLDEFFKSQVQKVQTSKPYVIDSKVTVFDDFGIFRSF